MYQKLSGRQRRKQRIRKKIFGTPERPRMSVFRSLKHISVQIVDDMSSRTIASASTYEKPFRELGNSGNREGAKVIGQAIGERALSHNVKQVVFDRSGFRFHGRIKALADAAREKGLKF
jgi:large subunit ribosomal protein L18